MTGLVRKHAQPLKFISPIQARYHEALTNLTSPKSYHTGSNLADVTLISQLRQGYGPQHSCTPTDRCPLHQPSVSGGGGLPSIKTMLEKSSTSA